MIFLHMLNLLDLEIPAIVTFSADKRFATHQLSDVNADALFFECESGYVFEISVYDQRLRSNLSQRLSRARSLILLSPIGRDAWNTRAATVPMTGSSAAQQTEQSSLVSNPVPSRPATVIAMFLHLLVRSVSVFDVSRPVFSYSDLTHTSLLHLTLALLSRDIHYPRVPQSCRCPHQQSRAHPSDPGSANPVASEPRDC